MCDLPCVLGSCYCCLKKIRKFRHFFELFNETFCTTFPPLALPKNPSTNWKSSLPFHQQRSPINIMANLYFPCIQVLSHSLLCQFPVTLLLWILGPNLANFVPFMDWGTKDIFTILKISWTNRPLFNM